MKRLSFQPRVDAFTAMVILAAGFACPAVAQRSCSAGPQMTGTRTAAAKAAKAVMAAARPDVSLTMEPAAMVSGGGQAVLTDPDGEQFSHQFAISAVVNNDGSAHGTARFVFPVQFSQKWGALPGVDLMNLKGEIASGSANGDGSVELNGPFIETDYDRGQGIVYEEDSRETGATPLRIVVSGSPGSKQFTLSWCAFIPPNGNGVFTVEVTKGTLKVL